MFANGCKGGHVDGEYRLHPGQHGYLCEKEECDFDVCEMCVRWALHCEKNKSVKLGLASDYVVQ